MKSERIFRAVAVAWLVAGVVMHVPFIDRYVHDLLAWTYSALVFVMLVCGCVLSSKIWKEKNGKTAGENGGQEV